MPNKQKLIKKEFNAITIEATEATEECFRGREYFDFAMEWIVSIGGSVLKTYPLGCPTTYEVMYPGGHTSVVIIGTWYQV